MEFSPTATTASPTSEIAAVEKKFQEIACAST